MRLLPFLMKNLSCVRMGRDPYIIPQQAVLVRFRVADIPRQILLTMRGTKILQETVVLNFWFKTWQVVVRQLIKCQGSKFGD